MSKSNLIIGRDLGLAICKHFGIDTKRHSVDSVFQIKTEPGQLAAVSLTLFMSPDELAGIARAAGASERATFSGGGLAFVGEQGPELINFAEPNTATLTLKVDAGEVKELLAKRVSQAISKWDSSGLPEHSKNQPMPEDSVQRGPKSGHFIDDHGIRHKNLGGRD